MKLASRFPADAQSVHAQAVNSLFALFENLCEGAIAVDDRARVVWINDKYRNLLGIGADDAVVGRAVEDVLPHSRMREVVASGQPILLDIMPFDRKWFVVTRIPIKDDAGATIGAVGFVLYDRLNYLKPLVARFTELQSNLILAERELAQHRRAKYSLTQFVGAHPRILEVKRQARRAAQLDTTILLLGETGTGKELLAHAIHAGSPRANRPFVGVNLAAVPDTLLEADFFGVAPGAYTGADRRERDGKFKIADGGTLFLDEIGEMPMALQAKLLRALQEQEIEPLGSNKLIKVNVRVIAATSRDLKQLVDSGQFRADLYYRLNVLPITLPPLRERAADIELLAEMLLERIARMGAAAQREITPAAVALLSRHDWPGNVRELANVLERAVAISDRPRLTEADFAAILPKPPARPAFGADAVRPLADALRMAERETIRAALQAAQGRKSSAAKLLGISRATLYERLARLGELSENST